MLFVNSTCHICHISFTDFTNHWLSISPLCSLTSTAFSCGCHTHKFVHVFACKTSCEKSFQYQVIMNNHRGPVICTMITCIHLYLYQHWVIHVCNECGHISFTCTAVIIKCKFLYFLSHISLVEFPVEHTSIFYLYKAHNSCNMTYIYFLLECTDAVNMQ